MDPCSGSVYVGVVNSGGGTGQVLAVTHATATPSPTPSVTPSNTPSPSPTPLCPGSTLISSCALIVADVVSSTVWAVSGSSATSAGTTTVVTQSVQYPAGVFVTGAGILFIASEAGYIYKMGICSGLGAPTVIVSLGGTTLTDVAVFGNDLYVADYSSGTIWRYPNGVTGCTAAAPCGTGSGRVAVGGAGAFTNPFGFYIAPNGDVYVSNTNFNPGQIVKVPAAGGSNVVVVSGLGNPAGVFVTAGGDVVASYNAAGAVAYVPASALPCTNPAPYSLGNIGNNHGVYVTQAGVVYSACDGCKAVKRTTSSGGGWTTVGSGMNSPQGITSSCNA